MAETQDPSIGWGGEVWLHNGAELYELVQVVSFGLPNFETEDVEVTHLKSPNRIRQFIDGLKTGGSVDIVINYRPGSDTDTLIRAAKAAGDSREIKFGIPENGVVVYEVETMATVKAYDRGEVSADGKMEATVTVRIDAEETQAAA